MKLEIYNKKNISESFYVRQGTSDQLVIDECYGTTYFKKFFSYKPTDIVLDVGANIGGYSTRVSKLVKEVHSYEPDKDNFELASKNLQHNNCNNVTIYNYALISNNVPNVSFYVNNLKNKGMHSLIEKRGRTAVTVNAKRFSEEVNRIKPNKIKLDIEGAEYDIFLNNDIDWSSADTIMMEWHQSHLNDKDQSKFKYITSYLKANFSTVIAPPPTLKAWTSLIYAMK